MTNNSGPLWERVQSDGDRETTRLPVEGGWLYCVVEKGEMGGILHEHVVFVRDPDATVYVEVSYCDDDVLTVKLLEE